MADSDHELEYGEDEGDAALDDFPPDQEEAVLEDEEETEDETEGEDEDEEDVQDQDGDEDDVNYIPVEDSARDSMSDNDVTENASVAANVRNEEERNKRRREGEGESCSSAGGIGVTALSQGSEWNRGEIDGLYCPICMDAWTSEGDHHISCLPCGHMYGMSCIKRWLQQKNSGKCPQCNRGCTMKGVRKLFASRIVAVDDWSKKRIQSLEAKCATLEKKDSDWKKKEVAWKKKESNWKNTSEELHQKIRQLKERTPHLEHLLADVQTSSTRATAVDQGFQEHSTSGQHLGLKRFREEPSCSFKPQKEFRLDGARLFDLSASNQMLLISRRLPGLGARDVLTKMSLFYPHETEDIQLPSNTKAVKDLCISPLNGGLALFASLGKRLAVLSLETNNIVLDFDLPIAAWSCSWDFQCTYYIYAGLQNGKLLVFDMRQTARPVESIDGISCNPIHTVYSLSYKSSGVRSVLSASSIGLCQWNIGDPERRTTLIPSASEDVCISLACSTDSDDMVATYRPKIEMSTEVPVSQASVTSSPVLGQVAQGSHVHFKRVGDSLRKLGSTCANVSDIRLLRSAVISSKNQNQTFASGDEATGELLLQQLPSLSTSRRFKLCKRPLRDIKYRVAMNQGLLTCLSDDTFQVFSSPLA